MRNLVSIILVLTLSQRMAYADKPQDASIKTPEQMEEERKAQTANGKALANGAKEVGKQVVEGVGEKAIINTTTAIGAAVGARVGYPSVGASVGLAVGEGIVDAINDNKDQEESRQMEERIKSEVETNTKMEGFKENPPQLEKPSLLKERDTPKPTPAPKLSAPKPAPKPAAPSKKGRNKKGSSPRQEGREIRWQIPSQREIDKREQEDRWKATA